MSYKSKEQAIAEYKASVEALEKADEALKQHFPHYLPLAKAGKFEEAKESCRGWPDSTSKILAFRSILLLEDEAKKIIKVGGA